MLGPCLRNYIHLFVEIPKETDTLRFLLIEHNLWSKDMRTIGLYLIDMLCVRDWSCPIGITVMQS